MWSRRLRSDRAVAAAARDTDEQGRARTAVPLDAGMRGKWIEWAWNRRSGPTDAASVDGVVDATSELRDVGVQRGELARRDHGDGQRGPRDDVDRLAQLADERDLTEEVTCADLVDAVTVAAN